MIADLADRLVKIQDQEADLALLQAAISMESITGNETRFASYLKNELDKIGLETASGEFEHERLNVWGRNSGDLDHPHLMFVGHTDTVHVRGWKDHWQGDPRADPFAGRIVDGEVWGRGACDLKGGSVQQ